MSNDPLENVDAIAILRLFETDVAHRRYRQAEDCLFWLLKNCSIHGSQPNKVILPSYDEREVAYVATRITSAVCQMFSDPDFGIDDQAFGQYAMGHANLVTLFGVSGFGSADHVIQNMLEPLEGRKKDSVSQQTFNKILLLHSIQSEVKLPYEHYVQSHPRQILWMVLQAVGALFCVTEQENSARNQLMTSMMHGFDISAFEAPMLGWLCIAWMHCSYATLPERNQFKKLLNRMLVGWMSKIGIEQSQISETKIKNNKPVLLVVNEYFKSNHAMYRCYAPTISALRDHFYVIGMTNSDLCDEHSVKCFDEHRTFEWDDDVRNFLINTINTIKEIGPSAIYYPSIGMQMSSILMANLRLAPTQFMSFGHPASSHSDVIDYFLNEKQNMGEVDHFSEKFCVLEDNAGIFVPHPNQPERSELLASKRSISQSEPVRLIITGSAMKINAEFVRVLSRIEIQSVREVEFVFIPNLNAISICHFRKKISSLLRRFVIHESRSYSDYLTIVSSCQIHLSPFPFGSTNSLVDSMILGIPLVVMSVENNDLQIDSGIVGKLNIEELKPATSIDEYVNTACRLIDSDFERNRITRLVEECDVEKIFFCERNEEIKKSVEGIYNMVMNNNKISSC